MEGSNLTDIDLEAPLDISTSDMLVPLSQQTFQHNWQKYQGKFLPNSLRYERNGWAAGWNVIEFKYNGARIKSNGRYIGRFKLNDNPTYLLCLYDTEDSETPLTNVIVNSDGLITYVSDGSATLSSNGSAINGVYNGRPYVINVDASNGTAALDASRSDGFSLTVQSMDDYSTVLNIKDDKSAIDIEFDLLPASPLTGTDLSGSYSWKGLDVSEVGKGSQLWGSKFRYMSSSGQMSIASTNKESLDGMQVVMTSLSDRNKITFDFTEALNECLDVSFTLEDWYTKFNDIKVDNKSSNNESKLINTSGSAISKLNKLEGLVSVSGSSLDVNSGSIDVTAKLRVYLSVSVQFDKLNFGEAKLPENVAYDASDIAEDYAFKTACRVYLESPGKIKISRSAMDKNSYASEDVDWRGPGWYAVNLHGTRFHSISISDSIAVGEKWQPYKYKAGELNKSYRLSIFSKLSFFNDADRMARASKMFRIYEFKSGVINLNDYFVQNGVFDLVDRNSAVFNVADISGFPSIKPKGSSDIKTVKADEAVVSDRIYDLGTPILDSLRDAVVKVTYRGSYEHGITIVDPDTITEEELKGMPDWNYDSAYGTDGIYSGVFFKKVANTEVNLGEGSFGNLVKYIPCFKYNGELVHGLVKNGYEIIALKTDQEFYDYVFGFNPFSQSGTPVASDHSIGVAKTDVNRHRIVTSYNQFFDFDRPDDSISNYQYLMDNLSLNWAKWYGTKYSDPNKWVVSQSELSFGEYSSWKDVELFSDAEPTVDFIEPYVKVSDAAMLFVNNCYGIVAYENNNVLTDSSIVKVYHNHEDVTAGYKITNSSVSGVKLKFGRSYDFEKWDWLKGYHKIKKWQWYEFSLPVYLPTYNPDGINNKFLGFVKYNGALVYANGLSGDTSTVSFNIKGGGNLWMDNVNCTVSTASLTSLYKEDGDEVVTASAKYELNLNAALKSETGGNVQFALSKKAVAMAVPLLGRIAFSITYPKICSKSDISYKPSECLVCSKNENMTIDKTKLWLDRKANVFSYEWFSGSVQTITDSASTMTSEEISRQGYTGYADFSIIASDESGYIFAPAKDWSGKEPKDMKEIEPPVCIPGVAFDSANPSDESGYMLASDTSGPIRLKWIASVRTLPQDANASLTYNDPTCQHKFYKTSLPKVASATVEIVNENFDVGTADAVISFGDTEPVDVKVDLGNGKYETQTVMIGKLKYTLSFTAATSNGENHTVSGVKKVYDLDGFSLSLGPVNGAKLGVTTQKDDSGNTSTYVNTSLSIPIEGVMSYSNCTCRFLDVPTDNYTVEYGDSSGEIGIRKLKQKYSFVYSVQQREIVGFPECRVSDIENGFHVKASSVKEQVVTAVLKGARSAMLGANNVVSFNYLGANYSVNMSDFDRLSADSDVLSADIRGPFKPKCIGTLKSDEEMQFLRQQWNSTVEVENYWWVDAGHILELNQYNFVLKKKTKKLSDWDGDQWDVVWEKDRKDLLSMDTPLYQVTNVYDSDDSALLLVYEVHDVVTVRCLVYSIRPEISLLTTLYFRLNKVPLGKTLNERSPSGVYSYFNTYADLNPAQLLSQAEWTNTMVDGRLIIGCHLSKNFDQWSSVFNIGSKKFEKCIQGYGYVGLHGDLTGGMLPFDFFDVVCGFKGEVCPVSELLDYGRESVVEYDASNSDAAFELGGDIDDAAGNINSKLNDLPNKAYGTADKQWYVNQKVAGIVSHLKYSGSGEFSVQLLPLTNNYASVYASPSFVNMIIGDTNMQWYEFAKMVEIDNSALKTVWNILMGVATWPMLAMVAPRVSKLIYLQQTLGQYAYVHYNSSRKKIDLGAKNSRAGEGKGLDIQDSEIENRQTDPILSSELAFGKQIITQNFGDRNAGTFTFYKAMSYLFGEAVGEARQALAVNEQQNQSAIADIGRKYCDVALENVEGLASTGLFTNGQDITCKSQVTGVKHLDMFYSTSDEQNVYAGPGFVEHQFVADCVAQSVTDVQTEGNVMQTTLIIRALTTLQVSIANWALLLAADALDTAAHSTGQAMICGNSLGLAAVVMNGVAAGIRGVAKIQELELNMLEKILDTICARGITCHKAAGLSRHSLMMEGTHKYGEKNETFMWPCWGVPSEGLSYTDERVVAGKKLTKVKVALPAVKYFTDSKYKNSIVKIDQSDIGSNFDWDDASENWLNRVKINNNGYVGFYQAACFGESVEKRLPADMAKVEGVTEFLSKETFKNENVSVSDPAFTPSMIQDYIIDKDWNLSQCATMGLIQWVTCKDTKVINCPPSNMYVNKVFCGVAAPYTAVEVKRGLSKKYMRPWAITPNVLALNCSGFNAVFENRLYHAFDGVSYRLVDLTGAPGLNKNNQSYLYAFQLNDRFKRSNICPANELQGNFTGDPTYAVKSIDKFWTLLTISAKEKGLEAGTIGEDKDLIRYSLPVFTEHVNLLPAAVKTLTAMPLGVVQGVTSLCTMLANNQAAYKAPESVDFVIGKNVYRATKEYICSVVTQDAVDAVNDLIPILGLEFIGSTPTEAFFYSESTRCYYSFSGQSLVKLNMMERFRNIQKGYWDFVNQEVVMPCLMTFKRLNEEVLDTDTETDNVIVPVLSKGQVSGELPPPLTTIFNDRSWYKVVSLPSGLAYQGPNRVIINRSVFVEYMLDDLKRNLGKWDRMGREKYTTRRDYKELYSDVDIDVSDGVSGWTHNPFLLVTSAFGQSENTDCMFEWVITFCWPIEMDLIYGVDNYAVVNVSAETMTPGGKVRARPTHIFLTKELFTRDGNYGYYSFRYQSKSGAGNRERLHIWSDQYIAISSLSCEVKVVTSRRTEQLTQQVDVQGLKEL